MSEHAVLAIPITALNPFVQGCTARYDPPFLSSGPGVGNAHVAALDPWELG